MGSIKEGYVNRGDIGLLMGGKRGPEVEPFRPKSETNSSVLDPLKFKEVSRSRERQGKRAISQKWKNESFV